MAQKEKVERPQQTIKPIIKPLSVSLKTKIATAFQEVVTKIKTKHLE